MEQGPKGSVGVEMLWPEWEGERSEEEGTQERDERLHVWASSSDVRGILGEDTKYLVCSQQWVQLYL